jgi:hypothetical protein
MSTMDVCTGRRSVTVRQVKRVLILICAAHHNEHDVFAIAQVF